MCNTRIFKVLMLLMLSLFALAVIAADEPAMTKEQQEAMAKWQAYATPGADHQWLAKWAGNWNTTSKSWMEGPDGPVTESKGTNTMEMILDGRFLKITAMGDMMGMKFHGMGAMGYDNLNKEYTMTWMDNMGTGIYTAHGSRSGDVMTLNGTMDDCMTGEKDKPVKYVFTLKDADHASLVMWQGDMKMFEDEYTRAN